MEKIFNKLVRDNIPEIIKSKNETPFIRILSDNEYKRELFRKLTEECNEVISTSKKDELLEELADVLEVVRALAKTENERSDIEEQINVINHRLNDLEVKEK